MKSRLRKIASEIDDENVSLEEAYQDITKAISKLRSRVGDWAVRDTLKDFTSWGFYRGSELASIDQETARDILDQLSQYVEEIKNDDSLYEVYDIISRYAYIF